MCAQHALRDLGGIRPDRGSSAFRCSLSAGIHIMVAAHTGDAWRTSGNAGSEVVSVEDSAPAEQ